jgi:hypothetical protein
VRVRARAATIDDAHAGRLENGIRESGRWLVSGEKVLWELACDPDLLEGAWKQQSELLDAQEAAGLGPDRGETGEIGLPCGHRIILRSGLTLACDSVKKTLGANLYAAGIPHFGIDVTPFSMGITGEDEKLSPGNVLRGALEGQYAAKARGPEEFQGRNVLTASVGMKEDELYSTISLDPARGFLPIHAFSIDPEQDGKRVYDAHIIEARECSGNRWFPTHWLVIWRPDGGPPFDIEELRVTRLDADQPPPAEEFLVEFPAGSFVEGEGGETEIAGSVRFERAERVTADDLQSLYDRCKENASKYEEQVASDARRERSVWRTILWWSGGILAILAALALGRRLRARAARS